MNVLLLSMLCHLTFFSDAQDYPDCMDTEQIKIGLKRIKRVSTNGKIKELALHVNPHPYPTLTIFEVQLGLEDPQRSAIEKKVIEGILNDFMALFYNVECPYTTGHTILPEDCSIEDVEQAIMDTPKRRFRDVYAHIVETYRSGDFRPQWKRNMGWNPKFRPVLVLISSRITGTVKSKYNWDA